MTRAELLKLLIGSAAVSAGAMSMAHADTPADAASDRARLNRLEARDAIHDLMMAYGRTLDNRDFQAFADLWASDAEYVQGVGPGAKGPAAIRGKTDQFIYRFRKP